MALSKEVKEFLESISKTISKETADILSTVIGKDVIISMNRVAELDVNELISLYPPEIVSVRFNISDKAEDMVYVLFEKDIAVKISSWMVMESEEGVEFSDEHLDSIRETANQILGHLSSVLSEELKRRVEFFSIRAELLKLEPNLFEMASPVAVEYSLNMGDEKERKITQVLSAESVERFMKGEEEEKPAEEVSETKVDEGDISQDMFEEEKEVESGESLPQIEEEVREEKGIVEKGVQLPEEMAEKIELLMDLSLPVTIELGRTRMLIKDILELGHGSVIEFDKLAGEPVDLLINDKKIAEGEVVVIDERFGIRLTNLVKPSERIKNLGK